MGKTAPSTGYAGRKSIRMLISQALLWHAGTRDTGRWHRLMR
jgi:hypothetical protein